jgi:hypothetical protein
MVLGGVWCETEYSRDVSDKIRAIKKKHNLPTSFEIKWTKVSPKKVYFYSDLIKYFFEDERLRFRGLLVTDKSKLDHDSFGQSHDEWYYKMYYLLLKYIIRPGNHYRAYIDIKDTDGGWKTKELHDVLANKFYDFQKTHVERIQQIRSHESEILQLSDLLIGAVGYCNRGLTTSEAKISLVEQIQSQADVESMITTSSFGSQKFNLFAWEPQGGSE